MTLTLTLTCCGQTDLGFRFSVPKTYKNRNIFHLNLFFQFDLGMTLILIRWGQTGT